MAFTVALALLYVVYNSGPRWIEDHPDFSQWSWVPEATNIPAIVCIVGALAAVIARRWVAHQWKVNHTPLGYYPLERPSAKVRRLRAAQRVLIVGGLVVVFGCLVGAGALPDEFKGAALIGVLVGAGAVLASLVVTIVRMSVEAQERYAEARR